MTYEPGYGLTEQQLTEVLVLDWLLATDGDETPGLLAGLYGVGDDAAITRALESFDERGWVHLGRIEESPDPIRVQLRDAGRAEAHSIREHRGDFVGRRKTCRDALLRWIYEETATKPGGPNLGNFLVSPLSLYYAMPYPMDEINAASRWLNDEGFTSGTGSLQGGIIRPTITSKGELLVESHGSVNDRTAVTGSAASIVFNVPGSNNVVQLNSPGATQNVTMIVTDDNRRLTVELADAIEQTLSNLPRDAAGLPAELRAAAVQSDPTVFQRVLTKVQTTLIDQGSGALGRIILNGAGELLRHFHIELPS